MQRRSVVHGDPRYKQLRARNNDSVKKSRDKARREYDNTMEAINQLEQDNQQLIQNLKVIKQEYNQLQDLFKQHTGIDIDQMTTTTTITSKSKSISELSSPSVSTREEPKENSSTPVLTINTIEDKSPSHTELDANNLDGSIVVINGVQYKIVSMDKN
jgi:seryl-tRNA synthetase